MRRPPRSKPRRRLKRPNRKRSADQYLYFPRLLERCRRHAETSDAGADRSPEGARGGDQPPIRNQPRAFPLPCRHWLTRRRPHRPPTGPLSSLPAHRSRAAFAPHRRPVMPRPPPRSTPSSPRDRRVRRRGGDIGANAAGNGNDVWMRVVMLSPSATRSMVTTVLGDTDMTADPGLFRQAAVSHHDELLGRSADGLITDHFTGSATAS